MCLPTERAGWSFCRHWSPNTSACATAQRFRVAKKILDCSEEPKPQEAEDSFAAYSGTVTQSRSEPKAYHISGTDERGGFVHIITGSMDAGRRSAESA